MPFPRHPRFRRAEKFTPMKLTARDAEILRMVNRHRFLRSHQIADLATGSRQQVLRRLQKLYHHGYVERPICQLDYYQRTGSRSITYGLASRGAAHLRRTDNTPFARLDWTARNRAIKRLFLEHALMVSDIMVSLELACRKRGDVRLLIENEISLPTTMSKERDPFRWTVTVSGKEKLGVIPDRIFALEFAGSKERILCFLEADRGTMPIHRSRHNASSFERKFIAYEATWAQNIHRSRFGFERVRVLAVTTSGMRITHLRDTASRLSKGGGLFLFADILSQELGQNPLAAVWQSVSGSITSLK